MICALVSTSLAMHSMPQILFKRKASKTWTSSIRHKLWSRFLCRKAVSIVSILQHTMATVSSDGKNGTFHLTEGIPGACLTVSVPCTNNSFPTFSLYLMETFIIKRIPRLITSSEIPFSRQDLPAWFRSSLHTGTRIFLRKKELLYVRYFKE